MWATGVKAFEKFSSFFHPDPNASSESSASIIEDTHLKRKRDEEEEESFEERETELKRTRSDRSSHSAISPLDLVVIPVRSLYEAAVHKLRPKETNKSTRTGRTIRRPLNLFHSPNTSINWPNRQMQTPPPSSPPKSTPSNDDRLPQTFSGLSLLDELQRGDDSRSFDRWLKQVVTQKLQPSIQGETPEVEDEPLPSFFDNTLDEQEANATQLSMDVSLNTSKSPLSPSASNLSKLLSPRSNRSHSIDLTLDVPEAPSHDWRRKRDEEQIKMQEREMAEKLEKLRMLATTHKITLYEEIEEKLRKKKLASQPKIPLTSEEQDAIDTAFRSGRTKKIVEGWGIEITGQDIARLDGSEWLNDEVINFYLNVLMQRNQNDAKLPKCHFFNTFFYKFMDQNGYAKVRTWTRRIDIFSMDMIIIPVHMPGHWCLAVVNNKEKKFQYFDSYGHPNRRAFQVMRDWLKNEWKDKKKVDVDLAEWTDEQVMDLPRQTNSWDCGVFICRFANAVSAGLPFNFTEEDMPYFRQRIALDILNKKFSS
eukprot:TRINITY_DN5677_c0_g1_i1.p1 TRINITY_DN5677_c0_g1~~TRINITY_DN5677_c0_g1_i1.p1  ORF type:complete len:536 (+),score=127.58 TRINITY_DN5677_c0_g1_i1:67-1674(+)